jgi:uncharacterized protein
MKILVAGASGMIGSRLVPYLAGQGHEIARLVRRDPGAGEVYWDPQAGRIDESGLEGFDGVVQLASMPWPARWTNKAKQQLHENRIGTNGLLSKALAGCQSRPEVLICASGMGIYPDSGEQIITEDSPPGSDFLAKLQTDGEAATRPAELAGIRVVNLRIPGVMGGENLKRSLPPLGNGKQWTSWVSRDELASIIEFALATAAVKGPVNPVSPNPVRSAEYTATHNKVLGRKPGRTIPAGLLKLMLGEMAEALILASRRMAPARLLRAGYSFRFPELEEALRHELSVIGVATQPRQTA